MRTRYHIDALNKSTFGVTFYDACSKPHTDAEKTANALGFESIYLYGSRLSKLGKPIWKKVLLHIYNLSYQAYVLWQARKLNSIKDADIFRPSCWNAFGMDKEGADYRACANFGPLYK